jgi:hypothetical protein
MEFVHYKGPVKILQQTINQLIMTLTAFRRLYEEDQYILWMTRAIQVSERDTVEYYYVLYQLDSFYIEMKFPKWSAETPVMRTFSKERRLIPYLYQINLNEVFSLIW